MDSVSARGRAALEHVELGVAGRVTAARNRVAESLAMSNLPTNSSASSLNTRFIVHLIG